MTPTHGGPVHDVRSKHDLAEHLSERHLGSDGHVRSITFPTASELRRWRREELDNEHRDLHGEGHR